MSTRCWQSRSPRYKSYRDKFTFTRARARSDGTTASPERAAQRVSDDELDATLASPHRRSPRRVRDVSECKRTLLSVCHNTHAHIGYALARDIHPYAISCVDGYLTIRPVFAPAMTHVRTCAAQPRLTSAKSAHSEIKLRITSADI